MIRILRKFSCFILFYFVKFNLKKKQTSNRIDLTLMEIHPFSNHFLSKTRRHFILKHYFFFPSLFFMNYNIQDRYLQNHCTASPVLTYAAEIRAETTPSQHILRTTEMKIIRAIHGKTLRDKIRPEHLQQLSGIQDVWLNGQTSEGENGTAMWIEWRKTVSQKTTGLQESVVEEDPRNDRKKTSMQFHCPKLLEEQASSLKRRGRRRRRRSFNIS